jgi:hypothetical protein
MRNLLQATDRDRLVAHLRGPLRREIMLDGRRLTALAEADGPEGGSFCSAAGNAQAAELLVQPEIRDADPGFTDAILDFVMAMADAPLPCRRAGVGGVEVLRADPRDFDILTPFHHFSGNLAAGVVRQQLRGPQETLPPVLHTGNLVEFHIGRHRPCVDAEETIRDVSLRRVGDGIVLMHESRIMGRAGWFRPREVEAGTLRYEYEIAADTPVLRLTVTFTAAATALAMLRVTTAVDAMDEAGLDLAAGRIAVGGEWRDIAAPKQRGLEIWAEGAPTGHIALGVAGWLAEAPALHIRPAVPAGVMGVKAVATHPGALHWLIIRHGPTSLAPGATLVVREERLLAVGTQAEAASRAMAGPQTGGLDLDPQAPPAAGLNAVAGWLLFAAAGAYREPFAAARATALTAWLDRQLARLLAGAPGAEELGHAAQATEARLRATGEAGFSAQLGDLTGRLLALQGPDGAFRDADGATASLGAHAVAVTALARALPHLDPGRLAPAIGAALAAVAPGPVELRAGGRVTQVEGLALLGAGPVPQARFAEQLGLLARAAGAVVLAAAASGAATAPEILAQAEALHRQAVALLRPLVRIQAGGLDVAPSPLGGAATPAAQAAVGLGLLAPDALILQLAPPRASPER